MPELTSPPAPPKDDIANYLKQFDRSPYRYPYSPYVSGPKDAVSTLKGSWVEPKKEP